MNHETYEKEMIDAVNRNAEEKAEQKTATTEKRQLVNKKDASVLTRGLKRTVIALWTVAEFAISVLGLIAVAAAPGYLAVILFLASILIMGIAFILLYVQGITYVESKGDRK